MDVVGSSNDISTSEMNQCREETGKDNKMDEASGSDSEGSSDSSGSEESSDSSGESEGSDSGSSDDESSTDEDEDPQRNSSKGRKRKGKAAGRSDVSKVLLVAIKVEKDGTPITPKVDASEEEKEKVAQLLEEEGKKFEEDLKVRLAERKRKREEELKNATTTTTSPPPPPATTVQQGENESESQSEIEEEGEARPTKKARLTEEEHEYEFEQSMNRNFAEIGIIEQITLQNFMCHSHLELKLGPNVNFIIGRNGSGKSAVLVALAVCLGASSSFTNRGNLANFIKAGQNAAKVTVVLRNRGAEALCPDLYGDSIAIERNITLKKQYYRINGKPGKTRDVMAIMDHFNIQIDNPCVILMQDTSRDFLNTGTPEQKYRLFMHATQLARMDEHFRFVGGQLDQMEDVLAKKIESLPAMEKKVSDLKEKYKLLKGSRSLATKKASLRHALIWLLIDEKKKDLEAEQASFAKCEARLKKNQDHLNKIKENMAKLMQENSTKSEEAESVNHKLKIATHELDLLKKSNYDAVRDTNHLKAKISGFKKQVLFSEKQKKDQQEYLVSLRQKPASNDPAISEAALQREKEIAEKQETLKSLKAEHATKLEELAIREKRLEDELKELASKKAKQQEIQSLTELLRQYEFQLQDHCVVYGRHIPRLLEAINNCTEWHHKPIGPIGTAFTVKDEKWAKAVEAAIGGLLSTFIVHDPHDHALLKRLNRGEIKVIIQKFADARYHLPSTHVPDKKYNTVLSQIDTTIPTVLNVLIDQAHVETKILVEDVRTAKQIVFVDKAHSVSEAYLPDGSKLMLRGKTEIFIAGNGRPCKLDSVGLEAKVKELEQTIQQMKMEQSQHREPRRDRKIDASRKEIHYLECKIQNVEAEIQQLQHVEQDDMQAEVEKIEGKLKTLNEEIERNTKLIAEFEKELATMPDKAKELSAAIEAKEAEVQKLSDQSETLAHEMGRIHTLQRKLASQQSHWARLTANDSEQLETDRGRIKKKKDEVEDTLEQAANMPRVKTQLSKSELIAEIARIDARMSDGTQMEIDDISKRYATAKSTHNEVSRQISRLREFKANLVRSLDSRRKRWMRFRKSIAQRTSIHFNGFMSRQAREGFIKFDHQNSRLDIEIVNKSNDSQGATQSTRELSGGERSFVTVALLLSLWDAMECPFRALDEFDVFMDQVNRRTSIQLLMRAAKEKRSRQFIFITPQDLSFIVDNDVEIHIHKMPDPVRNEDGVAL